MSAIDILLAVLLTAGLALSLPIWWWLFLEPRVRLWKRLAGRSGSFLLHLKPKHPRR